MRNKNKCHFILNTCPTQMHIYIYIYTKHYKKKEFIVHYLNFIFKKIFFFLKKNNFKKNIFFFFFLKSDTTTIIIKDIRKKINEMFLYIIFFLIEKKIIKYIEIIMKI